MPPPSTTQHSAVIFRPLRRFTFSGWPACWYSPPPRAAPGPAPRLGIASTCPAPAQGARVNSRRSCTTAARFARPRRLRHEPAARPVAGLGHRGRRPRACRCVRVRFTASGRRRATVPAHRDPGPAHRSRHPQVQRRARRTRGRRAHGLHRALLRLWRRALRVRERGGLFLVPDPARTIRRATVRFALPSGWTAVTPWTAVGDAWHPGVGGRMIAPTISSARHSASATSTSTLLARGSTQVQVAIGGRHPRQRAREHARGDRPRDRVRA